MTKSGRLLLGMDLGRASIRFVLANWAGGRPAVSRYLEIPLPAEVYHEGQFLDPVAAGQLLQTQLKTQLVPGRHRVAVAVGGQTALVRRVAVPRQQPAKIRHILETQGDQWIPFLREGAAFDFAVVDPDHSKHEQEILLVAVPTRYIEGLSAALRVAGLRLAALDLDLAALYRAALATAPLPAEGAVAVMDLERERPRIGLFDQGLAVGVRSLDTALPPPADPDLPELPLDLVAGEELLVETRRTLEMMIAQMQRPPALRALVLFAPGPVGELVAGLERELRRAMGGYLAPDFQVVRLAEGEPPGKALAFGLALVQARPPRGMHLLPRPTMVQRRRQVASLALSLAVAVGTGLYALQWSGEMPGLESRRLSLQANLNRLNAELKRSGEIAAEEALAQRLQPLQQDLGRYPLWSTAFPRLRELLPAGVVLNTLVFGAPNLSLTGQATAPEQVAELLDALERSPDFQAPVLEYSGGKGEINFAISLTLAEREGTAR